METTVIVMKGIGTGAGDKRTVLARKEIEKLINDSSENFSLIAYNNIKRGYKDGICVINIITGSIYGYCIGYNECNQACDNQEVILSRFSQNTEDFLSPTHGDNSYYFLHDGLLKENEFKNDPEVKKMLSDGDYPRVIINKCEQINPELYNKIYREWENSYIDNIPDFTSDDIQEQLDFLYS